MKIRLTYDFGNSREFRFLVPESRVWKRYVRMFPSVNALPRKLVTTALLEELLQTLYRRQMFIMVTNTYTERVIWATLAPSRGYLPMKRDVSIIRCIHLLYE